MTLQPLTVLVTRPEPQNQVLCRRIDAEVGRAISFPTISFAPPPSRYEFESALTQLHEQEALIFVSPQAVYASLPAIRRVWPAFPGNAMLAAVGAGTASALREQGVSAVHFPRDANSEGLLAMPAFSAITGQRIAVIRGLGGREAIDRALAERGARVLTVIAYQRVLPSVDPAPVITLLQQHAIDIVVCTSYEGVRNLVTMLGDAVLNELCSLPLIVMSERIKLLASDLGFQTIWVPREASDEAILQLIAQKGIQHE